MYPMIDFYCESINTSESTAEHHSDILSRIFRQMADFGVTLNEESIDGLSGAALQRWMNAFKKTHKPSTVNNYVVTLNPFLRWAHTIYPENIADFGNVLKTMRLPSYDQLPDDQKPKDKYYSNEQIEELLKVPKSYLDSPLKKRDRAIIAMFVGTGLRVSELCQLTIGSVRDYKHGYVRVCRKGGVYKDVDVSEFVYDYIEAYLQTRDDRADHSRPLFVTIQGAPVNRNQIYQSLRTKQRKMPGMAYGAHSFRHTFVSNVEKIGGAAVARDVANHKSFVMTNRYDHSSADQRHEAVNALHYGLNTRKS